jgi:hypothetical protein
MNRFLACTVLLITAATLSAQTHAPKSPPRSPGIYAMGSIGGKSVTIMYSSPRVNGREGHIFAKDGLIGKDPTYPVWRAGANAATKFHTAGDLHIGDLEVPKGDYTLYVDISDPENWVLIVNRQTGQWGTVYDKTKDLGRTEMTMSHTSQLVENLLFTCGDDGSGKGMLSLVWENHMATVPVTAP